MEVSIQSWRGTPSHHPFIEMEFSHEITIQRTWGYPHEELETPRKMLHPSTGSNSAAQTGSGKKFATDAIEVETIDKHPHFPEVQPSQTWWNHNFSRVNYLHSSRAQGLGLMSRYVSHHPTKKGIHLQQIELEVMETKSPKRDWPNLEVLQATTIIVFVKSKCSFCWSPSVLTRLISNPTLCCVFVASNRNLHVLLLTLIKVSEWNSMNPWTTWRSTHHSLVNIANWKMAHLVPCLCWFLYCKRNVSRLLFKQGR